MPAFPRTVLPKHATWPSMPTGLVSVSRSGRVQRRTTTQLGRRWTETFGVLRPTVAADRAFLSTVLDLWRNQTECTVDHRSMRTLLGAGGGTPLVNGASQTGSSLVTDGWPASTTVLKAGDVIRVAGVNQVLSLTADAVSNGSGQATLAINPPLYSSASPGDNAVITTNATPGSVLFTVFLEDVQMPDAAEDEFYIGLTITFRELPGVPYVAPSGSTVTDTFTRADSTTSLGTADTGQVWSALKGTWGISSGKAYLVASDGGGEDELAVLDAALANGTISCDFTTWQTGQRIIFRATDYLNCLFATFDAANNVACYKRVAGTFTSVGTGTFTSVSGMTASVVASGSSITVKGNGTTVISLTESFNASATKHGIGIPDGFTARFDNFSVT